LPRTGGGRHARDMKPDLRAELLRRTERDQAARGMPEPDWETIPPIDAGNLAWLKEVVAEVGWRGRSVAGEDGAHAAWLLAQHADHDPAFQRRCLDLITEAAACGKASLAELAYLTDRVLLAEGQAQEYGTQIIGREEGWVPQRLRDPGNVDERRAAMSLGPLDEYIARLEGTYGPARPASVQCAECGGSIEVWLPDEGEERNVSCPACGWTTTLTVGALAEPPDATTRLPP
jgi:hypothetical protein